MAMGLQRPRGKHCLMLAVNAAKEKTYESFRTFVGITPIVCTCKQEIDIMGLKNQIEAQMGLKLII